MSSLTIAVIVAGLIALSGFIGLYLQRRLADWHTSERSRDMIGGVVGCSRCCSLSRSAS